MQQVIVEDKVGIGWDVFTDIRHNAHRCHGEYVNFLSDDNALSAPLSSQWLRKFADDNEYPPVIIWPGRVENTVCPWQKPGRPRLGYINLGNLVFRRDVWFANKDAWLPYYEGDFYMADGLWEAGHRFCWMPKQPYCWHANAVLNGQPEIPESEEPG